MADGSSIEWTDATWNPIVGCSRVSPGCENCYAERFVHRGIQEAHRGLTVIRAGAPGWTGDVRFLAERLEQPQRWRRARRIFVNSLSDLASFARHAHAPVSSTRAEILRPLARVTALPSASGSEMRA